MATMVSHAMCAAVIAATLLCPRRGETRDVTPAPAQPETPITGISPVGSAAHEQAVASQRPMSAPPPEDRGPAEVQSPSPKEGARFLGATFDVGLPDGALLGVAARPWHWLRLGAGAGTNSISLGLRGGVTVVPFGVGPSASVEGGHYFEGNANGTASSLAGSSYEDSRVADEVGYQFANFHLGVEFGRDNFTFFLHGGMSYIHAVMHHVNDELGGVSVSGQNGVTTVVVNGEPVVSAWIPSAKLGFILFMV